MYILFHKVHILFSNAGSLRGSHTALKNQRCINEGQVKYMESLVVLGSPTGNVTVPLGLMVSILWLVDFTTSVYLSEVKFHISQLYIHYIYEDSKI